MKRGVVITGPAEKDVLENHQWWSENRSAEQAVRWLEGIYAAMWRLAESADRQPLATEIVLAKAGIKQAAFGLGRRPSHRIFFGIKNEQVTVFRVRAFKQDAIGLADLD